MADQRTTWATEMPWARFPDDEIAVREVIDTEETAVYAVDQDAAQGRSYMCSAWCICTRVVKKILRNYSKKFDLCTTLYHVKCTRLTQNSTDKEHHTL
jgi:hypothetical protein